MTLLVTSTYSVLTFCLSNVSVMTYICIWIGFEFKVFKITFYFFYQFLLSVCCVLPGGEIKMWIQSVGLLEGQL